MNIFYYAVMLFVMPIIATAASFDCTQASTKTEKMICSSHDLSNWDNELDSAYKKALDKYKGSTQQSYLRIKQQLWLSDVRDACQDEACLKEAYSIRVVYLKGLAFGLNQENSIESFELITSPGRVEAIKSDFQNTMEYLGINVHLQSCPIVLSTPWGRGQVNVGMCHYGSKPKEGRVMMLCSESMIGYFAIAMPTAMDVESAKIFAKANCLKGG